MTLSSARDRGEKASARETTHPSASSRRGSHFSDFLGGRSTANGGANRAEKSGMKRVEREPSVARSSGLLVRESDSDDDFQDDPRNKSTNPEQAKRREAREGEKAEQRKVAQRRERKRKTKAARLKYFEDEASESGDCE
eukprot:459605-Rhodomonas_salina.1